MITTVCVGTGHIVESVVLWFCFHFIYSHIVFRFFFFNDTATTEIYTLSLHDALPISEVVVPATEEQAWPPPLRLRTCVTARRYSISLNNIALGPPLVKNWLA